MSFPTRKIRTARSANRNTLQPSVRDFSDQVIGCYSEDGGLYLGVTSRGDAGSSFLDLQRPSPRFAGSTVTYSSLEAAAMGHLPATFNTPRTSLVTPEEVHRRHVAKSARLRSRLSGNRQLQRTRVLDSALTESHRGGRNNSGQGAGLYPSPRPVSASQVKRPWSDQPSNFIGHQATRARPATTGRYFNTSNGLRTSSTVSLRPVSSSSRTPRSAAGRVHMLTRPYTALGGPSPAWVGGSGLQIHKMTIGCKNEG